MTDFTDTYTMDAICMNCGNAWQEKIPKGITAADHVLNILCSNCKCGSIKLKPVWRFA